MTENQLIAEPIKYEPYFNPDTNQYNDKCPWKKHFRGTRKEYKCPCNSFMFITTQQFNQHIKRGVHKKWLANYDKETKEKLKVEMLKKDQGFAINVPVAIIKNSELYKAQTMDYSTQAITAYPGGRLYESSEPGYAISFKSVSGNNQGLMNVTTYFPVYNPVTGETDIQETTVDKTIMGRRIKEYRNHFFNVKVPELQHQNASRYQQAKSQTVIK